MLASPSPRPAGAGASPGPSSPTLRSPGRTTALRETQADAGGPGVLQGIREGLLHDAQGVQYLLRSECRGMRFRVHLPLEANAGVRQPRFHPVTEITEHGEQIVAGGLERIDGQAQIVDAFTQHRSHGGRSQVATFTSWIELTSCDPRPS